MVTFSLGMEPGSLPGLAGGILIRFEGPMALPRVVIGVPYPGRALSLKSRSVL